MLSDVHVCVTSHARTLQNDEYTEIHLQSYLFIFTSAFSLLALASLLVR